jgi:hypothetical protein
MLSGPPLPLLPRCPLKQLIELGLAVEGALGIWIREVLSPIRLLAMARGRRCAMLLSQDLGFLLGRCSDVAVRERSSPRVLAADEIIRWRTLQVVTGTPHLPSFDFLEGIFPGAYVGTGGFNVPIGTGAPEVVLADCLEHGIQVKSSCIVYSPAPAHSPHCQPARHHSG